MHTYVCSIQRSKLNYSWWYAKMVLRHKQVLVTFENSGANVKGHADGLFSAMYRIRGMKLKVCAMFSPYTQGCIHPHPRISAAPSP